MVYLKKYQDKSFIAVDSAVITDGTFNLKVFVLSHLAYGLTRLGIATSVGILFR